MSARRRHPSSRLQATLHRWHGSLAQPGSETNHVHAARVALKEARALLRLFRPAMGESRYRALNNRLRQAMKVLAPARDRVIVRQVLADQVARIDATLDRQSLLAALPPITAPKPTALRRVGPLLDEFERRLSPVVSACSWESLDQAFRDACRRVRKLQRQARHDSSPALWHRWRRRVKALAYQADFVRPTSDAALKKLRQDAWRLQAKLGELQDLHVTMECLSQLHIPPESRKPLRHQLDLSITKTRRRAWRARLSTI